MASDERNSFPSEPVREPDDEIAIGPLLARLWGYRQAIGLGLIATALASGLLLAAAGLVAPTERIGSVQFRLLFEGAEEGKYADESPFSPAELTATPVLTKVYETNDLGRYLPYDRFAESMFVVETSQAAALLAYEYEGRLADTRLAPADRARIEDEFRRRRDLIEDPTFSIRMRQESRFLRMPDVVMEKVLLDTLETWAGQAAERRGAARQDLVRLSRNILQEGTLESDDYLVVVDSLRVKTQRVIDAIEAMEDAPGAGILRTGAAQPTLPEIKANLEDLLRFEIEPLLNVIRAEGTSKNARLLGLYARSQLFQREQDRNAVAARIDSLRDALRQYTMQPPDSGQRRGAAGSAGAAAPAAPFGESFLDRLIELSTQTQASDVEYRQRLTDQIIEQSRRLADVEQELAYYRDLLSELGGSESRAPSPDPVAAMVTARTREIFAQLRTAVDDLGEVYTALEAQNLQPPTLLYTITTPFSVRVNAPFTVRDVGLYFAVTMFLALILLPVGCLVHAAVRGWGEGGAGRGIEGSRA